MDIRKLVRETVRSVIAELDLGQDRDDDDDQGDGDSDDLQITIDCNSEKLARKYGLAFSEAGFNVEMSEDPNHFSVVCHVPAIVMGAAKEEIQDIVRQVKGDDTESQGISDFFEYGEDNFYHFYDLRDFT